eukprot:4171662-Pleurochrysis_carterae.AAC.2
MSWLATRSGGQRIGNGRMSRAARCCGGSERSDETKGERSAGQRERRGAASARATVATAGLRQPRTPPSIDATDDASALDALAPASSAQ